MTPIRLLILALIFGLLVVFLAWSLADRAELVVDVETVDQVDDREMAFTPTMPATTSSTTTITTTVTTTTTAPVARSAPKPVYVGSIPDAIRAGFARFGAVVAEQAVRVSRCETAGTFDPGSEGDELERGLFQIHPRWHQDRIRRLGLTWDRMFEVWANIRVAVDLYLEQGWRPWTCRYVV